MVSSYVLIGTVFLPLFVLPVSPSNVTLPSEPPPTEPPLGLNLPVYNTSGKDNTPVRLCHLCPPGWYLVGDCLKHGEIARCKPLSMLPISSSNVTFPSDPPSPEPPLGLNLPVYNTSRKDSTPVRLCHLCPAGFYFVGDCLNQGEIARCKQCQDGTFQVSPNNSTSCALCKPYCYQRFAVIEKNCTTTSDVVCRCQPGYYHEKNVDNGHCYPHEKCQGGFGVKQPGTNLTDTVCEKCVKGKTFSNVSSAVDKCVSCTDCTIQGLGTVSGCTAEWDTVCTKNIEEDAGRENSSLAIGLGIGIPLLLVVVVIIAISCLVRQGKLNPTWKFCAICVKDKKDDTDSATEHELQALQIKSEDKTGLPSSDVENPELQPLKSNTDDVSSVGNRTVTDKKEPVTVDGRNADTLPDVLLRTEAHSGSRSMNDSVPVPLDRSDGGNLSIPVSEDFITKLSTDLISHNWKFFFRYIFADGVEPLLNEVESNHQNNVQEQIYQMLKKWKQKLGREATLDKLITGLREYDRPDLADKYIEMARN